MESLYRTQTDTDTEIDRQADTHTHIHRHLNAISLMKTIVSPMSQYIQNNVPMVLGDMKQKQQRQQSSSSSSSSSGRSTKNNRCWAKPIAWIV